MKPFNLPLPQPILPLPHLCVGGWDVRISFGYKLHFSMCKTIKKILLILLLPIGVFAQKSPTVTGTIGLYADFYQMDADSTIPARRPPALYRLVCNPTFSYRDFSLPFLINISPQSTSVIAPVPAYKNFGQYLANPLNQLGIAPKYKWVQLLLGTQIPHYSELTFGDQPVFGAGLRLTPGKFRFECFGGTSQQAIAEDTINNIKGAFKRTLVSAKIGYGKEEGSHIYLIGGYSVDDTNSLKIKPVYTNPQNGMLTSLDYRINLSKQFYVKGESAISVFTRDQRAQLVSDAANYVPTSVFPVRYSTRTDNADILTIGYDGKQFGLKAVGKYYGDGYVSLGYPFMQTDRMEVTLDPRFSLFNHKVNISGGIGERLNNLTQTRGATSSAIIGYANISVQATKDLNLSGNFSNYGFRNTVTNDSLRLQMVSMSYSFNPNYKIKIGKTINMFALTLSHDQFRDYNTISGSLNNNDANSGMFLYSLAFSENPLSFSLLASSYNNQLSSGLLSVNSGGVTCSYSLHKNTLRLSAGETYTQSMLNSIGPSKQLNTMLGVKYKISKALNFSVTGTINTFNAGAQNPLNKYTENLLRTSLIYKL